MSYIEQSLSKNEKIEAVFDLHWFVWLPMVLWIILAIPTMGITLILVLYEIIKNKSIEQGVTNKRVIAKKGIISRTTEEMKLTSIETVEIDQDILGRIFNFGTVKVTGRGISDVILKRISGPLQVKRTIEDIEPI